MDTDVDDRGHIEIVAKRRRLSGALVFACCAWLGLSALLEGLLGSCGMPTIVFVLIGCLPLAVASMLVWRCPACSRHLGRNHYPEFCQHCGARIGEKTDASVAKTLLDVVLLILASVVSVVAVGLLVYYFMGGQAVVERFLQ